MTKIAGNPAADRRNGMRFVVTALALVALALTARAAPRAAASGNDVELCHKTSSNVAPYTKVEVSKQALVDENDPTPPPTHEGHATHSGDIIPPFSVLS